MSETIETPYEDLLRDVLATGTQKSDRTGTGTRSVFGRQLRFDLAQGFPLITTKRVHFTSIAYELLWFLRGDSNVGWLREHGVTIWDEWADDNGELGPVYGVQWRSWPAPDGSHIDQIAQVIDTLRSDPDSRRMIVSAWNVADIPSMALAPCHALFQFYVAEGRLSCQLYQRSADMFLGVPFNIASYALLTLMVAQQVGLEPGEFVWTGGDCHIYDNHVEQVTEQLGRDPFPAPRLRFARKPASILDYTFEDFVVEDYQHHPAIRAAVAVRTAVGSVALIWAQAKDGVIGRGGTMPWHLSEDLAHFRALTGSDTVIMGRKTWDSLPERFRPLAGRANVVVTRQTDWSEPGAIVARSLEHALTVSPSETTWVIGGAELYRLALRLADRLEVTEIDLEVEGDAFAPPVGDDWTASVADPEWQSSKTGLRYRFLTYLR